MSGKQEQREQFEYARRRVLQKKRLMRHFVVFLAGSIVLIIVNPVLGIGKDWPVKDWFVWAILLWLFLFLIHALNVLFASSFMGKEWEHRQLEKLKAQQEKRINELQKEVDAEIIKRKPTIRDDSENKK
jgi:type VI protein secretion system component VasK